MVNHHGALCWFTFHDESSRYLSHETYVPSLSTAWVVDVPFVRWGPQTDRQVVITWLMFGLIRTYVYKHKPTYNSRGSPCIVFLMAHLSLIVNLHDWSSRPVWSRGVHRSREGRHHGELPVKRPGGHGDDGNMAVCQNLVPLVNIKIAGKWMFIPLKMVLIGIDPYPYLHGDTVAAKSCGCSWELGFSNQLRI